MNAGGGYLVLLDGRPVNTPVNRRPLVLPTASLAMGIAGEWASQERTRLAPWSMPLTSLACTAADQSDEDREQVIATVMDRFFEKGDVALCRCDGREDAELSRAQALTFDPMIRLVENEVVNGSEAESMLCSPPECCATADGSRARAVTGGGSNAEVYAAAAAAAAAAGPIGGMRIHVSSSLQGPTQDAEVVRRVGKSVRAMDAWRLAAFNSLAFASKSVVIATCAVRSPETVGIVEVMKAARVEEEIQIERWGLVEGGHDMDIGDLRVRVSSAMVYLRMLDAPWEALVPGAVRPEARSRSG